MAVTGKLPYKPPTLTNPTTIVLPSTITAAISLTPGTDYIIDALTHGPCAVNSTVAAALAFDGGNTDGTLAASNVVLIGGEFQFPDLGLVPTENAGNGTTTQTGRTCIIQHHKGTIHIEGCWFHGYGIAESLNCYSPGTTIRWQNCRVGDATYPVQNRKIGFATGPTPNDHPDAVAFIEQAAALYISRLDAWTAYQGLFLKNVNGETHPNPVELSDVQITNSDITGLANSCTKWAGLNSVSPNTLRDTMACYSVQTLAQTQSHSYQYQQSASWCSALATYKCTGTPAFVRALGTAQNTTNNTTIATTTTASVDSGDTIFAVFGHRGSGVTMSSVSGGGLTWTVDKTVNDAPNFFGVTIAHANAPSGLASGTTITGTLTGSNANKYIMLGEFSNVNSSSPLDKTAAANLDAQFTQGFTTPATATTSQDSELVISAVMAGFNAGGTLQPGSGASPTTAQQVIWNTQNINGNIPVTLDNVWVTLTNGSTGLDHHVWPDQSQGGIAPITAVDGSVSWDASTGYTGSVGLGPVGDMTLPGGSSGGPGVLYTSPGYVGDEPPPPSPTPTSAYTPLIYVSPDDPSGTFAAPPGTTVIRTTGQVYTKIFGTGTSGWQETA